MKLEAFYTMMSQMFYWEETTKVQVKRLPSFSVIDDRPALFQVQSLQLGWFWNHPHGLALGFLFQLAVDMTENTYEHG